MNELAGNRAVVTGATGFIGQHLIDVLLAARARVRALGRSKERFSKYDGAVEYFRVDLADPESLIEACAQADVVYHLAGYAHASDQDSPQAALLHRQITVDGTRALLAAATEAGVPRFVFLSSVKAMGEGDEMCLDEMAEVAPTSHYGSAKLDAERLVLKTGRGTGMHVSILRLPLVYGPGVKGNLRQMIAAIDRRRFPPLPEVGNKRSMVHVDDVMQALMLAAENTVASGQVYIVTDGHAYSTREMYEATCRALGRSVARWTVPLWTLRLGARVGDMAQQLFGRSVPLTTSRLDKLFGSAWYSSGKIRRELGFVSRHTFFDALPEMIAGYRAEAVAQGTDQNHG